MRKCVTIASRLLAWSQYHLSTKLFACYYSIKIHLNVQKSKWQQRNVFVNLQEVHLTRPEACMFAVLGMYTHLMTVFDYTVSPHVILHHLNIQY